MEDQVAVGLQDAVVPEEEAVGLGDLLGPFHSQRGDLYEVPTE